MGVLDPVVLPEPTRAVEMSETVLSG